MDESEILRLTSCFGALKASRTLFIGLNDSPKLRSRDLQTKVYQETKSSLRFMNLHRRRGTGKEGGEGSSYQ